MGIAYSEVVANYACIRMDLELNSLERLPFVSAHVAYESFMNGSQYMNELFSQKVVGARTDQHARGMDIMGSLVKTAYGEKSENQRSLNPAEKGVIGKEQVLSDSDILGNAFVMILAGYGTTANSIPFTSP
jgi:cytochrome P450